MARDDLVNLLAAHYCKVVDAQTRDWEKNLDLASRRVVYNQHEAALAVTFHYVSEIEKCA